MPHIARQCQHDVAGCCLDKNLDQRSMDL